MPRPKKWRKISFMPEYRVFKPSGIAKRELEEIQLKIEELEAMRLKDIENLNQAECAEKMQVSRQTFQLIIDSARKKVAIALTLGKAINITGGNFTYNNCNYICCNCGHEFSVRYEEKPICPKCGNEDLKCEGSDKFCNKGCQKNLSAKKFQC